MLDKNKTHLEEAISYYHKKDYKNTIKYALASLKNKSTILEAHFFLGVSYYYQSDYKAALDHLESFLALFQFDLRYKSEILNNWYGDNKQLFEANYFAAKCNFYLEDYKNASILYHQCVNKFEFSEVEIYKGSQLFPERQIYMGLQLEAKDQIEFLKKKYNINFDTEETVIIREKSFVCIACSDASISNSFKKEFEKNYFVSNVSTLSNLLNENKKTEFISYVYNIIVDIDFNDEEICNSTKMLHEYDAYTKILVFSDKTKISSPEQFFIDRIYPLKPEFEKIFSDIKSIPEKDAGYLDFLQMLDDD